MMKTIKNMKKQLTISLQSILWPLLIISLLGLYACATDDGNGEDSSDSASSLTEAKAREGLIEALKVGIGNTLSIAGKKSGSGGYLENADFPDIAIEVPDGVKSLLSTIKKLDPLIDTINTVFGGLKKEEKKLSQILETYITDNVSTLAGSAGKTALSFLGFDNLISNFGSTIFSALPTNVKDGLASADVTSISSVTSEFKIAEGMLRVALSKADFDLQKFLDDLNAIKKFSEIDEVSLKNILNLSAEQAAAFDGTANDSQSEDDIAQSLSRADGLIATLDIFLNAITGMSISDAKDILVSEADDTATKYLDTNTRSKLTETYAPVIDKALTDTGYTALKTLIQDNRLSIVNALDFYKANMATIKTSLAGLATFGLSALSGDNLPEIADEDVTILRDENFDLTEYTIGKALDGVFKILAAEEKKIRNNLSSRTTAILTEVFQEVDRLLGRIR